MRQIVDDRVIAGVSMQYMHDSRVPSKPCEGHDETTVHRWPCRCLVHAPPCEHIKRRVADARGG